MWFESRPSIKIPETVTEFTVCIYDFCWIHEIGIIIISIIMKFLRLIWILMRWIAVTTSNIQANSFKTFNADCILKAN